MKILITSLLLVMFYCPEDEVLKYRKDFGAELDKRYLNNVIQDEKEVKAWEDFFDDFVEGANDFIPTTTHSSYSKDNIYIPAFMEAAFMSDQLDQGGKILQGEMKPEDYSLTQSLQAGAFGLITGPLSEKLGYFLGKKLNDIWGKKLSDFGRQEYLAWRKVQVKTWMKKLKQDGYDVNKITKADLEAKLDILKKAYGDKTLSEINAVFLSWITTGESISDIVLEGTMVIFTDDEENNEESSDETVPPVDRGIGGGPQPEDLGEDDI